MAKNYAFHTQMINNFYFPPPQPQKEKKSTINDIRFELTYCNFGSKLHVQLGTSMHLHSYLAKNALEYLDASPLLISTVILVVIILP